MTQYPAVVSSFVLAVLGQAFSQPPHASLDYNKRFIEDQLAPVLNPGKVFYVAVDGKAGATGTESAPFRTLEQARDAIRKLKTTAGLPKGGVHVVLLAGNYPVGRTFRLTAADSGTRDTPIVYRGISAEKVQLSGGFRFDTSGMNVVEDEVTLGRVHPKARGEVMVAEVPKEARSCFPGDGEYGLISMDGHLLTLAQWPNRGYHHIAKILETGPTTRWLKPGEKPAAYSKESPTGGKFSFKEALSPLAQKEFERSGDMHAQGYFHNDWYFQHEPVGGIKGGVVQLLRYTRYGIANKIKSIPRRVRLVNVLAELDEQGEWYYDRIDGKLYVWPIKGFAPGKSQLIALGGQAIIKSDGFWDYTAKEPRGSGGGALVEMKNTACVTFRDVTFENTGNQAISISGGEHNLLAGCIVRNGLNKGASVGGGHHNGITGCDFYGLETAFTISGGDFKTLKRCYNFATNNDIHSCRRRGYNMINLGGVGLYFAHNVLHDMNGAVNYLTVDSLIEFNEFYNIGYEMGDFNVAYCGAVWYTMNNVVRFNLVHHLLEPGGHPVCGFRNDDGGMGLQLYGNVFYRPGRGAVQFAGPLNSFQNNITMNCSIVWWTNKKDITPEGIAKYWKDLEKFGRDLPKGDKGDNIYILERLIGEKGWLKEPWISEFPELARVLEVNPFAQTFCTVDRNYMHSVREPFHIHGGSGTVEGMESKKTGRFVDLPEEGRFVFPETITMDAFVDVAALNFNFKDGFEPMEGFKPIPFDRIGFVKDEFRREPPNKREYRREVYNRFKNDAGGRYNAARVNARYPEPSYSTGQQ